MLERYSFAFCNNSLMTSRKADMAVFRKACRLPEGGNCGLGDFMYFFIGMCEAAEISYNL